MVHLPIEVIPKGEIVKERIKRALDTANKIQSEFYFVISQSRELLDAVEFEAGAFEQVEFFTANIKTVLNQEHAQWLAIVEFNATGRQAETATMPHPVEG